MVDAAELYGKLRAQALSFGAPEIKAPPVVAGGEVLGIVMDIGYDWATVTLLGLADGTTSLYVSNGNVRIGLGDREPIAAATRVWLEEAERALPHLDASVATDLPAAGRVGFTVITLTGRLRAVAPEPELERGEQPLSDLYLSGQAVIGALRATDEAEAV